jgi:hypothetical protein
MIEIDIILGSKYASPSREEMICTSGAQVLVVAKSVLANLGFVQGIMARVNDGQLQLDDGGENT